MRFRRAVAIPSVPVDNPDDRSETLPDSRPVAVASRDSSPRFDDERYKVGSLLGKGGMGEVRLARDTRIDREVAVKLMRGLRDPELVARFFREARVQGALEHPAIVPVHDLGIDGAGVPYFVMKRLAGTTLAEVFDAQTADARQRWPRRLLLGRFVDICLAIEFAHARGVIHRDIKPANLMLGDFGEAYVLDWGLARIAGDASPISKVSSSSGSDHEAFTDAQTDAQTVPGQMLGTPGYMPPEQARGESIDSRSDVFGLGCVLYEILAGVPALPRGLAALEPTLVAAEHRPSSRATELEVPPELDDLCARATAANPLDRPSARQLAETIQAYLDGDRDLERRRELAIDHARRAAAALDVPGDDARSTAMREAGRAFVLDPGNATAKDVLTTLMLGAPATIPSEALAAADEARARSRRDVIRFGVRAYAAMAVLSCLVFLMPLHHVWPVVLAGVLSTATALLMHLSSRRPHPIRDPWYPWVLILNCVLITMSGLTFGLLLVMPMVLGGSVAVWMSQPSQFRAWMVIAIHLIPIGILLGLELVGVLPSTFRIDGNSLVLSSWVVELSPTLIVIILVIATISHIITTSVAAVTSRRAQEVAQNAVHAQRWHLQQVLPQPPVANAEPFDDHAPSRPR